MKKIYYIIIIAFIFSCCSEQEIYSPKGEFLFSNNCEALRGWDNSKMPFSDDIAHSGNCSSYTDSISRFSVSFDYKYSDLSDKLLKRVKLTAWVYFTHFNCKGEYVIAIGKDGIVSFWVSSRLQDFIFEENRWVKVERTFVLPQSVEPNSKISIYGWNTGKYPILFDDLIIEFVNY